MNGILKTAPKARNGVQGEGGSGGAERPRVVQMLGCAGLAHLSFGLDACNDGHDRLIAVSFHSENTLSRGWATTAPAGYWPSRQF